MIRRGAWNAISRMILCMFCFGIYLCGCRRESMRESVYRQPQGIPKPSDISCSAIQSVMQEAKQYIESPKGVGDFGANAKPGNAYQVFGERGIQESWIVEVRSEDLFVGAALRSADGPGFTSAVFPQPQDHFWRPCSADAIAECGKAHLEAKAITVQLFRDSAGHFWKVTGETDQGLCMSKLYTRYCP